MTLFWNKISNRSLKYQITFYFCLFVFVFYSLGIVFILVDKRNVLYDSLYQNSIQYSKASALGIYNLYSDTLSESIPRFYDSFKQRLRRFFEENPNLLRVAFIAKNGRVIFDSKDLEITDVYTYREDFSRQVDDVYLRDKFLLSELFTRKIKPSNVKELFLNPAYYNKIPDSFKNELFEVFVPKLESSGSHIIVVGFWYTLTRVKQEVRHSVLFFIVLGILLLISAFFLGRKIAERLVKPLKKLINAIRELEEGHLDKIIILDTRNEFGHLAQVLNQMAASLSRSFHENESQRHSLRNLNLELSEERRLLEQRVMERTGELEALNMRLKDLDLAKTNFFNNISHELRTPLTVILLSVEVLKQRTKEQESLGFLDNIHKNTLKMRDLVNDLLSISRIESGKMVLNPEKINLGKIIGESIYNLHMLAQEKKIKLNVDLSSQELFVVADPGLIGKAINNLLHNALKFTPENGEVGVAVNFLDGGIEIAVRDSGIGIPRAQQEIIFERFRQGEEGTCRKYPGTGIGLAFAKEIMELHGGSIRVESESGKGAVFYLFLPQAS